MLSLRGQPSAGLDLDLSGGRTGKADDERIYGVVSTAATLSPAGVAGPSGVIEPGDTIVVPMNVACIRIFTLRIDVLQALIWSVGAGATGKTKE